MALNRMERFLQTWQRKRSTFKQSKYQEAVNGIVTKEDMHLIFLD